MVGASAGAEIFNNLEREPQKADKLCSTVHTAHKNIFDEDETHN
jgi:hypothetical protein